jgi:maltokinase
LNSSSIARRLGALCARGDAPHAGDGLTAALVGALVTTRDGEAPLPPPFLVRRFHPLQDGWSGPPDSYGPEDLNGSVERGFEVDQTNHSVVVAERVVVKWLTPPPPLPQPAPEMFAHLTAVGFTGIAPPYAAVAMRGADGGERLLALVTGFLPEARDGWEWCVDEAVAGRAAFAADLGRLAADLHVAMATPSTTLPDPVRLVPVPAAAPGRPEGPVTSGAPDGPATWAGRAERALAEALDLVGGADGRWLAARAAELRAMVTPLAAAGPTPVIRIHGDLHVGQVLRWRDGYAVIDFDGNPTVHGADPYQPTTRDLAQLGTSLEHVGQVAIRRRGADPAAVGGWVRQAREGLTGAYTARLAERGRAELLDPALVRPFEVEQECRELIYAVRHLPRWQYAPMGVLRSWFPE